MTDADRSRYEQVIAALLMRLVARGNGAGAVVRACSVELDPNEIEASTGAVTFTRSQVRDTLVVEFVRDAPSREARNT